MNDAVKHSVHNVFWDKLKIVVVSFAVLRFKDVANEGFFPVSGKYQDIRDPVVPENVAVTKRNIFIEFKGPWYRKRLDRPIRFVEYVASKTYYIDIDSFFRTWDK